MLRRRRLIDEDATASVPERPDNALRLLTLNLAHGRGPRQTHVRRHRLESNLERVARTLRQLEPDVVALQEADGPSSWSGNFDHVATLAELSGLNDHFRGDHNPFGNSERFYLNTGTALITRHELQEPISHRFGENWRDTKGLVLATIDVPQWRGHSLDVVSVHLDFLTPAVRRRQIEQMAEVLIDRDNPLVLLGDLNCCWASEPRSMELLTEKLELVAFQPDAHSPTYPRIQTDAATRLDSDLEPPGFRWLRHSANTLLGPPGGHRRSDSLRAGGVFLDLQLALTRSAVDVGLDLFDLPR